MKIGRKKIDSNFFSHLSQMLAKIETKITKELKIHYIIYFVLNSSQSFARI